MRVRKQEKKKILGERKAPEGIKGILEKRGVEILEELKGEITGKAKRGTLKRAKIIGILEQVRKNREEINR